MAQNSLYPGYVKLSYTFSNIQHSMVLPVLPVVGWTVGNMPSLQTKSGGTVTMDAAITALMPLLQPFFGTGTEFIQAEAWFYPSVDTDPIWVYSKAIGLPGTAGTQSSPMLQGVISYRTMLGGIFKNYLMEISGVSLPNTRNSYPFGAGSVTNITTYFTGVSSWVVGRDGAFLVVPAYYTTKYNDALRKKRIGI